MAKQQFLEDRADTLRLTIYSDNRAVIPSSATVSMYKPNSTSTVFSGETVTIDATTGEMTWALTSTHTATRDLNYKVEWVYVVSSVTYVQTQLVDVVRSKLAIPITDDDLYNELDSIRQVAEQETGTVTSAAAGTLVDTAKLKQADNYWKGGTVEIISGTGDNQKRDITSSTQSSGTLNVSPNWTTTPDTTSEYRVVRSFSDKIEQSFVKIETMLYNKGRRHSLILESSQIEFPMIYLTIMNIATDLVKEEGDKWDIIRTTYKEQFDNAFSNMKLDYDLDDSGGISGRRTIQCKFNANRQDMKLSINILNWNCAKILPQTLDILKKEFNGLDHEIIIVDNGSVDGSQNLATIRNTVNRGISIGKNQGIDRSVGDYIMLLDGDIVPVPGSITCLMEWLDTHEDCDAIGFHGKNWTRDTFKAEQWCKELVDVRVVRSHCLYYGMFKRWVFDSGIRLYDKGVFGEEGYGYEDLDFWRQMEGRGIKQWFAEINRVNGKYYHDINSSFTNPDNMTHNKYRETSLERFKLYKERWNDSCKTVETAR